MTTDTALLVAIAKYLLAERRAGEMRVGSRPKGKRMPCRALCWRLRHN